VYEPYYGWTWVSYEPWGWAPYHYGRWFVYGGGWGWWPGPVYAGYDPVWAPAYVSFFGFGGGGWGVDFGFGFGGGFGNIGWLPCGPGDRFFPWYGRGINRVNVVNITNITNINNVHNNFGGVSPLRQGPHAFSNLERAASDARVRGGISSMQSNQFGRGRVPLQQSRIDAGAFRKASVMTGANPVSPSRQSFRSTDRQVSSAAIPSHAINNQRFFSGNARQGGSLQAGHGVNNFNRAGNTSGGQVQQNAARPGFSRFGETNNGNGNRGNAALQPSRPMSAPNSGQHGFTPSPSQPSRSIQSSRPGWHTFTPPSGQAQSNGGRTFAGQGGPQPRSSNPRSFTAPRQFENNSRGGFNSGGSGRPALNMHQPVVTPRNGGSYSGRPMPSAPTGGGYGGYRGGPPSGGSYSGRSMPSAPSGRSYGGGGYHSAPSGGGYHGGAPSGGSRGGSVGGGSHGGSSGGGHNNR